MTVSQTEVHRLFGPVRSQVITKGEYSRLESRLLRQDPGEVITTDSAMWVAVPAVRDEQNTDHSWTTVVSD